MSIGLDGRRCITELFIYVEELITLAKYQCPIVHLTDIPIEVYTDPIVAVNGVIENITGATIPVADMYVEGEKNMH